MILNAKIKDGVIAIAPRGKKPRRVDAVRWRLRDPALKERLLFIGNLRKLSMSLVLRTLDRVFDGDVLAYDKAACRASWTNRPRRFYGRR